MKKIYAISGLPRSGSTLLANIMAQHPDTHVTPTSGCHEVLFIVRNNWSLWKEHQADTLASSSKNLQRVLNSILQGYHDTDKPVVIDKARSWLHSIEMMEFATGEKAKLIVPVRNISEILASFEKLYRKNAHMMNVPGDFIASQLTSGRVDQWASPSGEVGIAYNRLLDAYNRNLNDRLLLVEFDDLTKDPNKTMKRVWDFLEMDTPEHNFSQVEQTTKENDLIHGYIGMHDINPEVKFIPHNARQILGKELVSKYSASQFWRI